MGFSISRAAELTGLTEHTLRYYEKDGLLVSAVQRDSVGRRKYSDHDIRWIRMLRRLRETGMPIRDLRHYIVLVQAGDGNERQRVELLKAHRQRIEKQLEVIRQHLGAVDAKISLYDESTAAVPGYQG
ncbi:MerR family transcriptional regulator [Paenarthrobacter nitroguajacolicus]|uniref:MerR family transcriptional regulator n=1 Tax=Paenarthrobacter nitroguajacolicus TaxID=211146 RepID=UPI00248CCCE9|nr:MerR family transcriptional regulator [Paenarthrobacter nitroguajacolicus]MDI2033016.1 putative HTH-type transcriptional regulator [Paenarthrobacter nitroguajacolicus]